MAESLFTLFSAPRATQEWHGDSEASSNMSATGAVATPSSQPSQKCRTPGMLLAICLTTSPHFAACALHSGFLVFTVTYIPSVLLVGFVTRYFETFFGRWSKAGPGRAFRIIPVLEGIGNGMMVAAVIRAAISIVVSALALQYASGAISDLPLASTYCRKFNLERYPPLISKEFNKTSLVRQKRTDNDFEAIFGNITFTEIKLSAYSSDSKLTDLRKANDAKTPKSGPSTGLSNLNDTHHNGSIFKMMASDVEKIKPNVLYCNEKLDGVYPNMLQTPAYNYFFVEVLQLPSDMSYLGINLWLLLYLAFTWSFIAIALIYEIIKWKKLVWNISCRKLLLVPCSWIVLLLVVSIDQTPSFDTYIKTLFNMSEFGSVLSVSNALEMSLYTHACGIGSELINGKGSNNIEGSSGEVLAGLRGEVTRTSVATVLAAVTSALAAAGCVGSDAIDNKQAAQDMHARGVASLWIMPMYSSCLSGLKYSHLVNVLIFGGMAAMQIFVAYILMKTALHAIFEFWKKIAKRQIVVICLTCIVCFAITVTFVTRGGPILLECVDTVVSGLATTFLCALEMSSMLWLYAGNDLMADLTGATENNVGSTSIKMLYVAWKSSPVMVIIAVIMKIVALTQVSMPEGYMSATSVPGSVIVSAIVATGAWNGYKYFKQQHPRSQ